MPLINVKVIENVFTPEQKVKIIETLTDAMVAIEGESLRELTFVLIEEVKQGDWGVGGKTLTASDVHRLQGAVAA
jgi:4-oxalocrotonate tautomerase